MAVADNIKPYPEAAEYSVWSKAKTDSVGDKISTGLGKALSKAEASYGLLEWHYLDAKRYAARFGAIDSHSKAVVAQRSAKSHFKNWLTPAIRDMEKAHAKAVEASKAVFASKARNTQAKAIAKALEGPIRVLKAIHINDFDALVEQHKPKRN